MSQYPTCMASSSLSRLLSLRNQSSDEADRASHPRRKPWRRAVSVRPRRPVRASGRCRISLRMHLMVLAKRCSVSGVSSLLPHDNSDPSAHHLVLAWMYLSDTIPCPASTVRLHPPQELMVVLPSFPGGLSQEPAMRPLHVKNAAGIASADNSEPAQNRRYRERPQ